MSFLYTSLFFSFLVALFFALLLSMAFRRPGPGPINGMLFIFMIIFIFSWAFGGWIEPKHPFHIHYPWISYLLVGFFIMLLLGALLPEAPPKNASPAEIRDQLKTDQAMRIVIGSFFWVLLISLLVIGLLRWI